MRFSSNTWASLVRLYWIYKKYPNPANTSPNRIILNPKAAEETI
jgi:hypothetical protein